MGVGVIQNVERKSGVGFPQEHFDHAVALDCQERLGLAHHPGDRIADELAEVGIPGAPKGAVNVAGKVNDPRAACFG